MPPKGAWPGSCDPLLKSGTHLLSPELLKLDTSNFVRMCIMASTNWWKTNFPQRRHGTSHVTLVKNLGRPPVHRMVEARHCVMASTNRQKIKCPKVAWPRLRNPLLISGTSSYLRNVLSYKLQIWYVGASWQVLTDEKQIAPKGISRVTWPSLKILYPLLSTERLKLDSSNFVHVWITASISKRR